MLTNLSIASTLDETCLAPQVVWELITTKISEECNLKHTFTDLDNN